MKSDELVKKEMEELATANGWEYEVWNEKNDILNENAISYFPHLCFFKKANENPIMKNTEMVDFNLNTIKKPIHKFGFITLNHLIVRNEPGSTIPDVINPFKELLSEFENKWEGYGFGFAKTKYKEQELKYECNVLKNDVEFKIGLFFK